jgi:hypothetical protein
MPTRKVAAFEEQTGITTQSDDFIVNPERDITAVLALTAGTPTTGARLQVTIDTLDKIQAGTALWVTSPQGNHTANAAEKIERPVNAVRLVATDGTWTLQVRHA